MLLYALGSLVGTQQRPHTPNAVPDLAGSLGSIFGLGIVCAIGAGGVLLIISGRRKP